MKCTHTVWQMRMIWNGLHLENPARSVTLSHFQALSCYIFSSPDPKGHVNYCHHLSSVCKLFKKSSPLYINVHEYYLTPSSFLYTCSQFATFTFINIYVKIQLYKGPSRQRSRSMRCAQMWYW
jgi:hypothetical protein